jgi:hypothetical protein
MTGINVGMSVSGAGIPANTLVTAITTVGFTLSFATTLAIVGGTLTLGSGKIWSTVAVENGTIELSSNLYDPTRTWLLDPTLPASVSAQTVALRDGSWELRVLADALRYGGLLMAAEVNTMWFNMINFVHSQQDDIDWVFKTSFMNMVGYDVPLIESPYTAIDQTASLVSYIDEVKPYRVKVRSYSTQYSTPIDIAHYHGTDFDKPVYFDTTLAVPAYRVLDPIADVAILKTAAYIDWYTAYQAYEVFLADLADHTAVTTTHNTPSLFRQFDLTLLFDRIVGNAAAAGWDMLPWNAQPFDDGNAESNSASGAAFRILNDYAPTGTMPVGLSAVMNLQFKASWIDGFLLNSFDLPAWSEQPTTGWDQSGITAATVPSGTLDGGALVPSPYATTINSPLPDEPGGLELRAPYRAQEHPEERVAYGADDGLQLIVTTEARIGGLPQTIKVFTISNATAPVTLFFDLIVQSASAVMVFNNGLRAVLGTDYVVDQFARTITINPLVNHLPLGKVIIHGFGFGGDTAVNEKQFLTYGTNPLLTTLTTVPAFLSVIVNGVPLANAGFSLVGNAVSLTAPPAEGADVALIGYTASADLACYMQHQQLPYNSAQRWTLGSTAYPYRDTATVPEHAGTIVELNGLRLTPPSTFYGAINGIISPWFYLPVPAANATATTVYVDDVEYTAPIPICTTTSLTSNLPFQIVIPTGQTPSLLIAGQLVFFENMVVALDPSFGSAHIAVVMQFATQPDYTVSNGVLTCNHPMQTNDSLTVTTFSNADCLGIQTIVYPIDSKVQQGGYLISAPHAPDYALVTMNGLALAPNDDFQIARMPLTYNEMTFPVTTLTIDNQTGGALVATLFTATPAKTTAIWLSSTRTPAFIRMLPTATDDGPLTGVPVNGPDLVQPLLSMSDSFEQLTWNPINSGVLAADCVLGATTMVVNLFTQPMSLKLTASAQPLPLPNTVLDLPGAIWINTERVEYFSYTEAVTAAGTQVTLGQLRRGTRGTSFGVQRVLQSFIADGSPTTYTIDNVGTVDVMVNHNPVSSALFSVAVIGTTTQVTVSANASQMVTIGITTDATHLAGTLVYANQGYHPTAAYPSGRAPGPVIGLMSIGTASGTSFVVQWQMPQYGQE